MFSYHCVWFVGEITMVTFAYSTHMCVHTHTFHKNLNIDSPISFVVQNIFISILLCDGHLWFVFQSRHCTSLSHWMRKIVRCMKEPESVSERVSRCWMRHFFPIVFQILMPTRHIHTYANGLSVKNHWELFFKCNLEIFIIFFVVVAPDAATAAVFVEVVVDVLFNAYLCDVWPF